MEKFLLLISENPKYHTRVYSIFYSFKINVVQTKSVIEAEAGLKKYNPAFVLLDFYIKGSNSLLHNILLGDYCPRPYVIVAADYANGDDRAAMLERGADYCIEEPINANEVLAVIESVLRRNRSMKTIVYKEMTINKSLRTVTMRGKQVLLTRKEYDVLCVLISHIGKVLTKEEIYETVWNADRDYMGTQVSDHIFNLRRKLKLDKKDQNYIQTVFGVGYRFAFDE